MWYAALMAIIFVWRQFPVRNAGSKADALYELDPSFNATIIDKLLGFNGFCLHKAAYCCEVCGFPVVAQKIYKLSLLITTWWLVRFHGWQVEQPESSPSSVTCHDDIIPATSATTFIVNDLVGNTIGKVMVYEIAALAISPSALCVSMGLLACEAENCMACRGKPWAFGGNSGSLQN
jgi:hypothetical protein